MSGKRRKYTPEFREQAARLVIETGRPVAHVAAEIGVGEQLLGRWVRLQRQAASAGDTGAVLDADERTFVLCTAVGRRPSTDDRRRIDVRAELVRAAGRRDPHPVRILSHRHTHSHPIITKMRVDRRAEMRVDPHRSIMTRHELCRISRAHRPEL